MPDTLLILRLVEQPPAWQTVLMQTGRIVECPSDGNCVFHAAVFHGVGGGINHATLRQHVADYMVRGAYFKI